MGAIGDILGKFKMGEPEDEYFDEEDDFDETPVTSSRKSTYDDDRSKRPAAKVTPIGRSKKINSEAGNVYGIKPESMENAKEVTDTLLEGRTVILNLEGLDVDLARRILDFAMGSTYALNGIMQKISNSIFIIVPNGVEIDGAFQDLIGSSR